MENEIIELQEDVFQSPLYSDDLAPVPPEKRTWGSWDLAALWVGMAVCIPTYLLASYMIKSGVDWVATLIIIGLANLIITLPMVLNGHGGVKYGIPFPVIGRAAFGTRGIHIPAMVRALVACGWFGIQTWIGGLAFYAIWHALAGSEPSMGLDAGKFICFGLFWLLNIFIIWRGIETIRWLEDFAAPILILIGILLIIWGAVGAGGLGIVLEQSQQLEKPAAVLSLDEEKGLLVEIHPLRDKEGNIKASEYQLVIPTREAEVNREWQTLPETLAPIAIEQIRALVDREGIISGEKKVQLQLRAPNEGGYLLSSIIQLSYSETSESSLTSTIWQYLLWLTVMVGFWATMSISISDITRYARTQKQQIKGQLIGLPGAMILYSFVGIFVTCAAVINFKDILIADDAPWDPITLLGKFESPLVVVISQIFMIVATLSTNIAANVIAPANAFSNLFPRQISFRLGGVITGIVGILICPWWLLDEISNLLIFVSGLLGPVLGILLADYYMVRKKSLKLAELYKPAGIYAFGGSGFNIKAMIALVVGVLTALIGYWVPALDFLYNLSWFTGFTVSFFLYWGLMRKPVL